MGIKLPAHVTHETDESAAEQASGPQGSEEYAVQKHARPLGGRRFNRAKWLMRRHASVVATYVKIAVGFCQCLGVFRHFAHVHWPEPFNSFVEWLNVLNVDWSQIFSVECHIGCVYASPTRSAD